jgi:hypothetical protein
VRFKAWLRSIVPVDHLEIICDGKVVRDLELSGRRDATDEEGTLPISSTGWCLLRASTDKAVYPVLDQYPYATTSPIYITVEGSKPQSTDDASYFMDWIDQLIAGTKANNDWNTDAEKVTVLDQLFRARKVYEKLLH